MKITVSMKEEFVKKLQEKAAKHGMSTSEYLRLACLMMWKDEEEMEDAKKD